MNQWLRTLLFLPLFERLVDIAAERTGRWFFNRIKRQNGRVSLDRKTIYVLPTRYGFIFGFVLFVMLMGAINYSNSMGFLLTFLLAGTALTAMLYCFQNLAGLVISSGKVNPVFAGDTAVFSLIFSESKHNIAYAIHYGTDRRKDSITDVFPLSQNEVSIRIKTEKRGLCVLSPIRLWTEFPLGLFHVWSWVHLDKVTTVYPRPAGRSLSHLIKNQNNGEKHLNNNSHDDYAGMRRYQKGDSPKHIAWKAVAKGHDLLTKQFTGFGAGQIWLDWYSLEFLETEQRLSQLCLWVLEAHRINIGYGLKLPNLAIEPATGEQHKQACLEAIALFRL